MIFPKYSPVSPLFVAKKPANRKQKKKGEKPNKPQTKPRNSKIQRVTADRQKGPCLLGAGKADSIILDSTG